MRGDLNSKMSSINAAFQKGRTNFQKQIDDIIMQAGEYELEARENAKTKQVDKEKGR